MGCASSKTTTTVEAPTLLTSQPQVNAGKKVATTTPPTGTSSDATALQAMIEDTATSKTDEIPIVDEPAPEVKTKFEDATSANKVADVTAEEPAKIVDVTVNKLNVSQAEAEEVRGISVDGGCCGIGGGLHAGCHGCGLSCCGLGGDIRLRDTIDENEIIVEGDAEARGISVGGGCCGIGGGLHAGCHGCGLSCCGLGGDIRLRDTIDENEIIVEGDAEARGISVGGGCCGIGGGAHAGCHGCSLNCCGLGGDIRLRDTIDENEIIVEGDAEARGISVGGGCCGIGGGAHAGCHGCSLNCCGLGGNIHVRDATDETAFA